MYSELRERLARERKKSAVIRHIDPAKESVLQMYLASALWQGRTASRDEIDALPLSDIERAVEQALTDFPSWALPEPRNAAPRATAEERLDSANAELARKAQPPKSPDQSPAAKREKLARLPADIRLAIANGANIFGLTK